MKQAQQSTDREVTCEARCKAQRAKRDASVKNEKRKCDKRKCEWAVSERRATHEAKTRASRRVLLARSFTNAVCLLRMSRHHGTATPLQHARVAHGVARWCTRCSVSAFFVLVPVQSAPLSSLCLSSTSTVAQCRLAFGSRTADTRNRGWVLCVRAVSSTSTRRTPPFLRYLQ